MGCLLITHLKNLSIQATFLQALFPDKCQHSFPLKMQGLCSNGVNQHVSVKNIRQFRPSDKGGREAVSKNFFRPSPQFALKIRGEDPGPLAPPLDPPLQLHRSRRATLGVPTNGRSIEAGTKGFPVENE